MSKTKGTLRTCRKGHKYYKSSACPACPICETKKKPGEGFLALLSAPARRALDRVGIQDLTDLAKYTESEILLLHGVGPASLPKLRVALKKEKLSFAKSK